MVYLYLQNWMVVVIDSVEIVNAGSGLQGVGHSVFSLINDNGLSITKIDSVQTGIMTLICDTCSRIHYKSISSWR